MMFDSSLQYRLILTIFVFLGRYILNYLLIITYGVCKVSYTYSSHVFGNNIVLKNKNPSKIYNY